MAAQRKVRKRATRKTDARERRGRTKQTATDQAIVVYIHGIGDQPPKERLKHQWDLAAFGKDMGDRTRMAYWSDILHGRPGARSGKKAASQRKAPLEAAALLEDARLDPEDPRALRFVESLAASVAGHGAPPSARRGVRTKALPLPGFLRKPIAERFLRWFVKDTAAYFFDDRVRKRIQDRLIQQIPVDGQPFILVSHSQGTIVSHEVLSQFDHIPTVMLFITMGSPLGLQEVQDLLIRDEIPLEVPPQVRAWHNFADRLDPVALDATLDQDIRPRDRVAVHDHLVVNERTKELMRFNPHSSIGYLSNPSVRSVLHHALGFDSAGRFVVARDVVERFVGVGQRQPVLIEALHPGYWAVDETSEDLQKRERRQPAALSELTGRIDHLAKMIRDEIDGRARAAGSSAAEARAIVKAAHVTAMRKYVAAHLTPEEIEWLASAHRDLNVYAVWRSAEKRKLITRSLSPIKVDAARASYGAEGDGITWAILDTGARADHPHFSDNDTILDVLDCTGDGDVPRPVTRAGAGDRDGHGTHVAGIIAGESKGPHGRRIRGIAPRAKLLVYKVLDDDGFGEDAWIIKAIDDIYRRNDAGVGLRVHGVNLSLGGPFDATVYGCGHSPICKELWDLWRQGVVVCVAAGNEGQIQVLTGDGEFDLNTQLSIGDPANLQDCIAVGSVNTDKPHLYGLSYFSSRGPTADGRAKPDVVAPGERILSCNSDFKKSGRGWKRDTLYRQDSGTSMACPHVSGMIAAFLSVRREFRGRPDDVKRILLENCNDLGRDRYHQGAGLPNLMRMLLNT